MQPPACRGVAGLSKVVRPAPGPTNCDATKEARSVERVWGSGGGVAGNRFPTSDNLRKYYFGRHLGRFDAVPRATLIVRFHCITIQEMKSSFGLISPSQWLGHLQDRKRKMFQIYPNDIWIHVHNHWQFLPYKVRLFCPYEHTTTLNGSIVPLSWLSSGMF